MALSIPTSPPPRRGRPPAADSQATRQAIYRAAKECFAVRGYSGASMAAIARAADVATSVVYYYARSKAQLFADVVTSLSSEVTARYDAASDQDAPLAERLDSLLLFWKELYREDPLGVFFLASRRPEIARNAELAQVLSSDWRVLQELITRLIDQAASRHELPEGIDRRQAGSIIWAFLDSLSYTSGSLATLEEYDEKVDTVRDLLRTWAAPRTPGTLRST